MVKFFPEAITASCLDALTHLKRQPWLEGYYLAGGTALALQIGHRISTDLDWFTSDHLLETAERETLRARLIATGAYTDKSEQDGQLYCQIAGADVSFVYQHHALLEPTVDYDGVQLASPIDIGIMKLSAINSRGTRRDFVDLYCLRDIAPLERLLQLAEVKYADRPSFLDITVRALAYFADAEQQPMPRMLWKNVQWTDVVKYNEAGAKWLTHYLREKYK
jgi:hypothetical protein